MLCLAAVAMQACSPSRDAGLLSATADENYREPHRPQFHFTPPSMWMNDPNGMVYFDGEYHLFYQYYPDGTVWGPMHWGHAVSRDLVRWKQLPIALYPDEHGYIFSGSAVVDWNNSSGFGRGDQPPLVAIFTYHDPVRGKAGTRDHESQGIAFSNDRGRSWTKYGDNPVLPNPGGLQDFRDPNVFWHAATERWIMALSVHDQVQLWSSPDLKHWEYLSAFGKEWGAHGGVWECPDLFPLTVEGTDETRWVLILNLNPGGPQGGSGTQYFVGDFDGRTFTLDESFTDDVRDGGAVWLDWGRDNYAGVTWSDMPKADGRRIFIGWMSNWDYAQQVPTDPWRSAMTLPRSLRLERSPAGYRVYSEPVAELQRLVSGAVSIDPVRVAGTLELSARVDFPISTSELILAFRLDEATADDFGVELANARGETYRVGYLRADHEFYSDRRHAGDGSFAANFASRVHRAPRIADTDIVKMHLVFDVASVELFADGGAVAVTDIFFPTVPFDRLSVYAGGGGVEIVGGRLGHVDRIW